MSYTVSYEWSECHASEQPRPQRDGVTIRAIENEKIVPGKYDGDDARVERGEKSRRPSTNRGLRAQIRLIYLKLINIQRTNERRKEYII